MNRFALCAMLAVLVFRAKEAEHGHDVWKWLGAKQQHPFDLIFMDLGSLILSFSLHMDLGSLRSCALICPIFLSFRSLCVLINQKYQ